jgi:hypothetical protein
VAREPSIRRLGVECGPNPPRKAKFRPQSHLVGPIKPNRRAHGPSLMQCRSRTSCSCRRVISTSSGISPWNFIDSGMYFNSSKHHRNIESCTPKQPCSAANTVASLAHQFLSALPLTGPPGNTTIIVFQSLNREFGENRSCLVSPHHLTASPHLTSPHHSRHLTHTTDFDDCAEQLRNDYGITFLTRSYSSSVEGKV